MVTSISATERIKLWNQFSTCTDHETIKTDFIRRVHRKNPPFRSKLRPKPRFCAEIPPMVEFHYKNPPPLLPSLKDVLRCERVYREHGLPTIVNGSNSQQHLFEQLDKDLQEIRVAHEKVRQFDTDLSEKKINETEPDEMSNTVQDTTNGNMTETTKTMTEIEMIDSIVESVPMENDEKIIEKIENQSINSAIENGIKNSELNIETSMPSAEDSNQMAEPFDNDTNNKIKPNRKRKRYMSSKCFGSECDDLLALSEEVFKSKLLSNSTNGTQSPNAKAIDDQLDGLDVDVIKRLALAQLQQILKESPEMVTKYQNDSANKAIREALKAKPVKMTLPSQLLSKDDIAKIAEKFTNGIDHQSDHESDGIDAAYAGVAHPIPPPPQLNTMAYYNATGFEHIQDDNERALAIAKRLEKPLRESKIRARAVLVPVGDILAGKQWYTNSHLDDGIFMRYRSLTIGSGPGCDLQMKNVRKCARLSSNHAKIFYDEVIEWSMKEFTPKVDWSHLSI